MTKSNSYSLRSVNVLCVCVLGELKDLPSELGKHRILRQVGWSRSAACGGCATRLITGQRPVRRLTNESAQALERLESCVAQGKRDSPLGPVAYFAAGGARPAATNP